MPARRIELPLPSYQEGGLRLTYAGKNLSPWQGLMLRAAGYKSDCSTLSYTGVMLVRWIEHRASDLRDRRSAD
jgi:hypothetical protein